MNGVLVILFIVAAFHFCLYYCNMDFFTKKTPIASGSVNINPFGSEPIRPDPVDLSETKDKLEKHLNELKQVSSITAHG